MIEDDYSFYHRWFEVSLDLVWRLSPELKAFGDPMQTLAVAESVSKANAIRCLAVGIIETVTISSSLPNEEVEQIDETFRAQSLPPLSTMRIFISKEIQQILRKGRADTEGEYYILKAIVDGRLGPSLEADVQRILVEYESRST